MKKSNIVSNKNGGSFLLTVNQTARGKSTFSTLTLSSVLDNGRLLASGEIEPATDFSVLNTGEIDDTDGEMSENEAQSFADFNPDNKNVIKVVVTPIIMEYIMSGALLFIVIFISFW